jgi:SAM-dependent methyltransferase
MDFDKYEREPALSETTQAHSAMIRIGGGVEMGQSDAGYPTPGTDVTGVTRRPADSGETVRANRQWWDAGAADYQAEHGDFLGDADFVWGPEGLREADAHLLGEPGGRTVLEIGCGAAQCGRWLVGQGARVVALDLSAGQLHQAHKLDERTGVPVPVAQADAQHLPIADGVVDIACSAYGALPFVADSARVMAEAARVLRPGGRWVFSVTHPMRWCFLDDEGPDGLVVRDSYFDRRPYVEYVENGQATYVEHHRTIGDRVREITAAGLQLVDLVEPEWPDGHEQPWGPWSPLRGKLMPGTAIFVTEKPRPTG